MGNESAPLPGESVVCLIVKSSHQPMIFRIKANVRCASFLTTCSCKRQSFDTATVLKVIRKIRPKLSQGPDGIPQHITKNMGLSITYPFNRFFEFFMSDGQVSSEWKSAIVTPILPREKLC